MAPKEIIVDKHGVRQAGTIETDISDDLRVFCERSLFNFAHCVMGRDYLTASLHKPICDDFLARIPPYRKLLLLPRRHAKTSMVSHALPIHLLIQPREHNIYFPGKLGANTRILMAQETERRAMDNMRVLHVAFESNLLLRRLWPNVCWDKPSRDSRKWNERAIIIPREVEFPDPSVSVIGVGGAITGARFDVMIKDDLITEEAANSDTVMQNAIQWHINSRALFDDQEKSLEYIIGTRWAVADLYQYVIDNDPTVDVMCRSIVEDGQPIYPEAFSPETVKALQQQFGVMFWFLFMNKANNPEVVDFYEDDLRSCFLRNGMLYFDSDARDEALRKLYGAQSSTARVNSDSVAPEPEGFMRFRS